MGLRWLEGRRRPKADAAFFADCHRRLDALLRPALAFWASTVDRERGGFFGLVDHDGRARPEADKFAIQQLRHLWTFSCVHRLEDPSDAIREICDQQLAFVRERLYAPERRSFHPAVSCDGEPREGAVHLYHLSFGLLGLAGYALAFPRDERGREALALAKNVFAGMVERSYDATWGFDETAYPDRWCTEAKEINTQMHVLEAIAELLLAARAHGDPAASEIEAILDVQLRLVVTRGIVQRGRRFFCSRGYARDWSVVNELEVDYGHDIEVVYLAMEAAKALGKAEDAGLVRRVIALGRSVAEAAYDAANGKWLYSGHPLTGEVLHRDANVWSNFEALNGLSTLYELTGSRDDLAKFERVLAWLETKQLNHAVGEWYYSVDESGRPLDVDVFGGDCAWMTFAWKSSYHSLRALVTRKKWIEEMWPVLVERR